MLRIPKSPPPIDELIQEAVQSGRFEAIWGATVRSSIRYHHWDTLRHLKPPDDLSHREWWLSLKLQRGPLARVVPLRSTEGTPFAYVSLRGPAGLASVLTVRAIVRGLRSYGAPRFGAG